MKDSFYFPHDYNARSDQKVLKIRAKFKHVGYSVFWMILESMAEEENGYLDREALGGLSIGFDCSEEELISIIDFCIKIGLFQESEIGIFSLRMLEHKKIRKALSDAGKRGVQAKKDKKEFQGGVKPPLSNPVTKERKGKEIKVKEKKEDIQELEVKNMFEGIPEELRDVSFISCWESFVSHRKETKKPMTERAKEMMLKQLSELEIDHAIKTLENSIANGWQGIFPEKVQGQSQKINPNYKPPIIYNSKI